MRTHHWWREHIVAALASYWIYQHIGNLEPHGHADDELLSEIKEADDGWPILERFARAADESTSGTRWSYCRDLGRTRVVVIDSRAGRVLEEGRRSMLDDHEWEWVEEHFTGDFDHLLVATSLPWLLAPGMHYAEAWSEAIAGGAWGAAIAPLGERLRQAADLEHWAAFQESFARLGELLRPSAPASAAARPPPSWCSPATCTTPTCARWRSGATPACRSHVFQAVCSPYRNPLEKRERQIIRLAASRGFAFVTRALAAAAGVPEPDVRWRMVGDGPWFDNQLATLTHRRARDRGAPGEGGSRGRDLRPPGTGAGSQAGLRAQLSPASLVLTGVMRLHSRTMLAALAASWPFCSSALPARRRRWSS